MLPENDGIRIYFRKLGLEPEIADLYLALHTYGPQTISELSRNAKIERTRIYRLIDKLLASNLIEVETHYKRGVIKAAPITNLHILINEKEQELKSLQDELGLIEQVLGRNSISSPVSRVQFYHGPEGIRQMFWNELRAKTEIVGYNYRPNDDITGQKFMQRWAAEFVNKGLQMRVISGEAFGKSMEAMRKDPDSGGNTIEGITYRYLSEHSFPLTHTSEIYDNVVAYYIWKNEEVFGVELYSNEIATMQRHLFELIWAQSTPETRF